MQVMKTNTFDFLNDIKPYGLKYNRDIELKEIAKMIRKELKPLVKLGFKFSVRTKHYTTIDIKIIDIPIDFILYNPYYDQQASWEFSVGKRDSFEPGKDPRETITPLGKKLSKYIKSLANQWNYDNSDIMTDYFDNNYFLFVMGSSGILI